MVKKDILDNEKNIIPKIDNNPKINKDIKKMIKEDNKNIDKKTKQYLGRFELINKLIYINNDQEEEQNIGNKLNDIIDKIETLYWHSWLGNLTERLKNRIIWLFYYIKGDIRENYSRNLDYKILELIEKNLTNYKTWYPWTMDRKQWELIKAKLLHLSKYLLQNEGEAIYELTKKYSIEREVDGVKLTYWLIPKDEYDKKVKEVFKEEEQMKDEFQKLLWAYLFNLWD